MLIIHLVSSKKCCVTIIRRFAIFGKKIYKNK